MVWFRHLVLFHALLVWVVGLSYQGTHFRAAADPANVNPNNGWNPFHRCGKCAHSLGTAMGPSPTWAGPRGLNPFSTLPPDAIRTPAMKYFSHLEADGTRVTPHSYSDDLRQRIADHNAGGNATTARHRPWQICAYLAFPEKSQALASESNLKSGSGHAFANKRLQSDVSYSWDPKNEGGRRQKTRAFPGAGLN